MTVKDTDNLAQKTKQMPQQSGVYLMKNNKQKIIYVGKAKNLRARLKSYFVKDIDNLKIKALVREISDVEVIITANEIEALLLERTLIKHQKPKYNVLLRDDKEYPYLRIDLNEKWPRIEKVRRKKEDDAVYLGPYGNIRYLNLLLGMVYRIFPLIRCSRYQFKYVRRPCNYYQMQMCLAPCHLDVDRDKYLHMLKQAIDIFQGKTQKVAVGLEIAMQDASKQENFEQAAKFRDQLVALKTSTQKQTVVLSKKINADVFGIDIYQKKALIYVLLIREGFVLGNDHFILTSLLEDEKQVIAEFLLQYYEHRPLPEKLLLPFAAEKILFLALPAQKCKVVVPKSGEEQRLISLAQKNASFQLRYTERNFSIELKAVQELLGIEKLPHRIECLDISNFQFSAIVASIVCFIDGKPHKKLYRRYKIAEVGEKPDDYKSIATVVERRLQRAKRDNDYFDLLLIDGGKGQLHAAMKVLADMGMNLSIASLAKERKKHTSMRSISTGERVFVPHSSKPISLPPSSPAFRLLTHLRDEAHRFAITYHRNLRKKMIAGKKL